MALTWIFSQVKPFILHCYYDRILENGFEIHTNSSHSISFPAHGCTCFLICVACVNRVIAVREQYTDNKKPKTTGPVVRTNNNRPGVVVRKGLKPRRIGNKVVPGNKTAGKKDVKTEKATPNGTAKEAPEGDAKPAEGTEEVVDENTPSKYEEIPVEMLVCKVCKKTSADAKVNYSTLTIIFYNTYNLIISYVLNCCLIPEII